MKLRSGTALRKPIKTGNSKIEELAQSENSTLHFKSNEVARHKRDSIATNYTEDKQQQQNVVSSTSWK